MNGEWLGSRAIRVNWANQKTQTGRPGEGGPPSGGPGGGGPGLGFGGPRSTASPSMGMGMGMPPPQMSSPMGAYPPPRANVGMAATPMAMPMTSHSPAPGSYHTAPPLPFDQVLLQTPEYNTTVYVGNLIPYTTQADLIPLFQGYGYIVEIRMQADRGFAFIKLDTHQNAALAITQLTNQLVHGRPIKCSWGKDKAPDGHPAAAMGGAAPPQQSGQYGMVSLLFLFSPLADI
jgi:nucleolysin TIA-1/TIAR